MDIGAHIKAMAVVEVIAVGMLVIEIGRIGQEVLALHGAFLERVIAVVKIVAGKIGFLPDDVVIV